MQVRPLIVGQIAAVRPVGYADAWEPGRIGGCRPVFTNPFAELSASIPPTIMQAYVVVMILMVAGGTLLDIMHKKSAKYFFDNWQSANSKGSRQVGGGEMASVAMQTAVVDVLASGEFCNVQRRIAHLLTMYGFLAYVVTTAIMVFAYPTPATPTPAILPVLWYVGALMICLGGYWFWFFIRADVAAEGNSPFRLMHADLFVISLLASATLGLLWAAVQTTGNTPGRTYCLLCISSPRRCCSGQSRGPSSLICSSSPRQPSRNGSNRRTVRGATCRPPPTNRQFLAAPADRRIIID